MSNACDWDRSGCIKAGCTAVLTRNVERRSVATALHQPAQENGNISNVTFPEDGVVLVGTFVRQDVLMLAGRRPRWLREDQPAVGGNSACLVLTRIM